MNNSKKVMLIIQRNPLKSKRKVREVFTLQPIQNTILTYYVKEQTKTTAKRFRIKWRHQPQQISRCMASASTAGGHFQTSRATDNQQTLHAGFFHAIDDSGAPEICTW